MPDLVRDLARAMDVELLAADVGLADLDPWQREFLASRSRRRLVKASRQVGKSSAVAVLALHRALYDPGLILLASPTLGQSQELFKKITGYLARIESVPRATQESTLRVELENGARIISLPGSSVSVRGFSAPRLVALDEAAFVSDELVSALRPTLATSTDGEFVAISSAGMAAGWFYREWTTGEGWERWDVKATDCPRIAPEFLAAELREHGPTEFAREYMGEFTSAGDQLFDNALIQAAFDADIEPLWPEAA